MPKEYFVDEKGCSECALYRDTGARRVGFGPCPAFVPGRRYIRVAAEARIPLDRAGEFLACDDPEAITGYATFFQEALAGLVGWPPPGAEGLPYEERVRLAQRMVEEWWNARGR
jgi:hypothetical protein